MQYQISFILCAKFIYSMKELTVKQYAALRGITEDGVRKAIRRGHNLPGVTGVKQFGKAYVIVYQAAKNKLKKVG